LYGLAEKCPYTKIVYISNRGDKIDGWKYGSPIMDSRR
jgi:hypothetical protein